MNKKDSFDKFMELMDLFNDRHPVLFDIVGHIVLISCIVMLFITFLYAIK